MEARESLVSRLQHLRVGLDQLSEIAEEAMSWLQEVKLGVSLLPLSETLQELLSVARHKLGCQLYNVRVYICQHWMADDILVRGVGPHIPGFLSLVRVATVYHLANLALVQVFTGFE